REVDVKDARAFKIRRKREPEEASLTATRHLAAPVEEKPRKRSAILHNSNRAALFDHEHAAGRVEADVERRLEARSYRVEADRRGFRGEYTGDGQDVSEIPHS